MNSEVSYNRFNENYIIIPTKELERMIYFCEWNIEEICKTEKLKLFYIRKREIFKHILGIIKKYDKELNYIVISKDNALYKELITNTIRIINLEMIESAYRIAVIEANTFMITQITKIKKDIENYKKENYKEQKLYILVGVNIYKSDIALEYGQGVADYIWENDSLDDYVKRLNGSLPHEEYKHVFLYQNGKIEEMDLPDPVLTKHKNITKTIN